MENKYSKFFEKQKNSRVINPTNEELKELGFIYNENDYFSYLNKEKNIEIKYMMDICNFWRYRVEKYSEELYLYSIEDIKEIQQLVNEGFVFK